MLPQQRHNAPAHLPTPGLVHDWRSRCWERRRRGTAGHVEQALVLLVGLVQHRGQWRNMFTGGVLTFLIEPGVITFPFLIPLASR